MPERLFLGSAAVPVGGRPADLRAAIDVPADADREAGAQRPVADRFFTLLAAAQVALAVAVLPLLRRARRHAGPHGPERVSRRVVAIVELLLIAAALAMPAALLADAAPWWRGQYAGWWFAAVTVLLIVGGTAAVRFCPGHERTLGPLGAVAGLATLVLGVDVLTGSRLQLNGVIGYSALDGGRYAGVGTVGLGVFIAGSLFCGGWLAQRAPRAWRPMVMVVVGGVAVVLVGSPYLGADSTGAIALTAGVSVGAAICAGGWLTMSRLAWATMAGLALTVGFAMIDLRRPEADRGSVGRFLAAVGEGTGGLTVHRASTANVETLFHSPLTVLALVGAALVWLALLQPWGGLLRLFGIYPAIRAAMAGTAVAAGIGGVLGGAALDVAGAAGALVVPMAALAALRVLDHATDRTQPGGRPGGGVGSGTAGGPSGGGDRPGGGPAPGFVESGIAGRPAGAGPSGAPDETAGPDGRGTDGRTEAEAAESGTAGRPARVPAQGAPAAAEMPTS